MPISARVPKSEQVLLKTKGTIARYHRLLDRPNSTPLTQHGYIIGIEKAPSKALGYPLEHRPDTSRLQPPEAAATPQNLISQQATFNTAFGDPKLMFVSHILRYATTSHGIAADLEYATYSRTAFGDNPTASIGGDAYSAGWDALDALEARIMADIQEAEDAGAPFTQILLMSMGWNNDQTEAVERYNDIVHHTRAAAKRDFNPLVIGLTWPSVWGGNSIIWALNKALHIGSYTVKAVDADEIGFGIANHITNAMLPRIENATGLQTVAIGHSMGARILSRAYYAAGSLKGAVARGGAGPLVIGLQGAFSANRFLAGYQLSQPFRLAFSGEGAPYFDHAKPGGDMVLTWSERDRANPVAQLATGAKHVGAAPGAEIMHSEALSHMVHAHTWAGGGANSAALSAARQAGKIAYVNATDTVEDHGDIRDRAMGDLVWRAMEAFGRA